MAHTCINCIPVVTHHVDSRQGGEFVEREGLLRTDGGLGGVEAGRASRGQREARQIQVHRSSISLSPAAKRWRIYSSADFSSFSFFGGFFPFEFIFDNGKKNSDKYL